MSKMMTMMMMILPWSLTINKSDYEMNADGESLGLELSLLLLYFIKTFKNSTPKTSL